MQSSALSAAKSRSKEASTEVVSVAIEAKETRTRNESMIHYNRIYDFF
jgi:hypothetical protein